MTVPCIVGAANTGSLPAKASDPAVPITVAGQVKGTQEAWRAGAVVAHRYVRGDEGRRRGPSALPG